MSENLKHIYNNLPQFVKFILLNSEGWLVGKAVENIFEGVRPKDYDILVHDRAQFQKTLNILANFGKININTFGGIKYEREGVGSIDIWCQDFNNFIGDSAYIGYLYNLKKQKLLKNE